MAKKLNILEIPPGHMHEAIKAVLTTFDETFKEFDIEISGPPNQIQAYLQAISGVFLAGCEYAINVWGCSSSEPCAELMEILGATGNEVVGDPKKAAVFAHNVAAWQRAMEVLAESEKHKN